MTRLPSALALATALALASAASAAQTIPPPETPVSTTPAPSTDVDTPTTAESPATVTADDRAFLTRALGDSERALAAVELAREQADAVDVRELAGQIGSDLAALNTRLTQTGAGDPPAAEAATRARLQSLSSASGAAFDRQWLDHMVAVHAQVITDFEREAANAKSTTVRDFATATLPTLRDHVDKLNALRAKLIAETP